VTLRRLMKRCDIRMRQILFQTHPQERPRAAFIPASWLAMPTILCRFSIQTETESTNWMMVLKDMTLSVTLQMDTPSIISHKFEWYRTINEETPIKTTLYRTSKREVFRWRDPIFPVTEYGASPKHLTIRRIGFKTVNVSANTAVILVHEEPSFF
jgi:hypothetical protein